MSDMFSDDYSTRDWAYHRFVNTTPKPRATKNKRGELVGLELLPFPLCCEVVAAGDELVVIEDIAAKKSANKRYRCSVKNPLKKIHEWTTQWARMLSRSGVFDQIPSGECSLALAIDGQKGHSIEGYTAS